MIYLNVWFKKYSRIATKCRREKVYRSRIICNRDQADSAADTV
jgi:hypothetical protein